MFTCLVIVMCLLGRSWLDSLNSSTCLCWLLLAVIFCFSFPFFDSILTLEAQLLLQSFCDCDGFVSELPMGFHRVFCSLYGFPLGICVDSISQLMGDMPYF